jgi:hypothetical protein
MHKESAVPGDEHVAPILPFWSSVSVFFFSNTPCLFGQMHTVWGCNIPYSSADYKAGIPDAFLT